MSAFAIPARSGRDVKRVVNAKTALTGPGIASARRAKSARSATATTAWLLVRVSF